MRESPGSVCEEPVAKPAVNERPSRQFEETRNSEGNTKERRIYDRYRNKVTEVLESKIPAKYQRASDLLFLLPDLVVLILRLLRDGRVPAKAKVNLAVAFVYLGSPVDLIPDFVPVFGQLDDLVIAAIAVHSILRITPEEAVRENWSGPVDVLEGIRSILDVVSEVVNNGLLRRMLRRF